MSKIPRSFVTPSSKLPMSLQTPNQLPPPKFIYPSAQTPVTSTTPLHEISNKVESCEKKTTVVKKVQNVSLKRNAPVTNHQPPSKQVKLVPKNSNVGKIASYDYKARFNDLSEKHKVAKTDYNDLKEKYETCSDELESVRSSFDSVSNKSSQISNELERILSDHQRLKSQYEVVSKNYDSEKETNTKLLTKVKDLEEQVMKLKNDLNDMLSQLTETQTKLSAKSNECDLLKTSFEKEIQKCAQLNALCEENQIKILSCTSELTFLNTRQKILEQRNDDNNICIANMKQEIEDLNCKLSNVTKDLEVTKNKLQNKTTECDKFMSAYNAEVKKCSQLDSVVQDDNEKITSYRGEVLQLTKSKEFLEMKNFNSCQEIEELKRQNFELQKTIEGMHESQKGLRNEIQDLKGHIRVFCRIRPPLSTEASKQLLSVDVLDSSTMEIDKTVVNGIAGTQKKQKHNFSFDGIFPSCSTQDEVFSEVSSLIQSALDGYNVCIFAYGQTGSGKTYTMEGFNDSDYMGIVPRAFQMIFSSIPNLKKIGWEVRVSVSFLEIYNENIYDLLDSSKDQEDHSIKMVDSKGNDVYVSNLKEETVTTAAELMKWFTLSQKNRQTAATLCNERSSRSHSVSKIKIYACHEQRKEKYTSNLNLVDLAGSESGKTSQRMEETKSINKSLSELSKVILALQSKQSHIPYRNSKLTYLLMPSLGGNSKTLMLVNIAQFDECYQETMNSLRFAAKVNSCRNGVTKKNISSL